MTPASPLAGQTALVTGGARRLGKAIAIDLARRGVNLAIHANCSIDAAQSLSERLSREHGIQSVAMASNLSSDSAENLISKVRDSLGSLDLLVHSAAVWPKRSLEETTRDDLRECLEVNTVAAFMLSRAAGLAMAQQEPGGAILLIGDTATGPDGAPYPGYPAYHASKAAIPGMTRTLAIELADRNPRVRVNALLPGPVICEHLPVEPDDPEERKAHALRASLIQTSDAGGYGRAEHVAHAAVALLENPFLTGVCLPVDGGGRLI